MMSVTKEEEGQHPKRGGIEKGESEISLERFSRATGLDCGDFVRAFHFCLLIDFSFSRDRSAQAESGSETTSTWGRRERLPGGAR
jgi:hypothetical protein